MRAVVLPRPSLRRGVGAVACAAALMLAGCAAPAPSGSAGPSAGAVGAPAPGPASPGAPGSPVTLRAVDGSTVRLPSGRPTVIFFFTTSCGDCSAGIKGVAAGLAKAAPGTAALAVELDPGATTEAMKGFMGSVGNPPLTLVRDDGTLLQRYAVTALGLTVVLDASGREVYRGIDPSPDQTAQALAAAADGSGR